MEPETFFYLLNFQEYGIIKTYFWLIGTFAKAADGRLPSDWRPYRLVLKTVDNDTPSPLARSSEMNRPVTARPRDVSGCTFLSVLTVLTERKIKTDRQDRGLAKASRERSERVGTEFHFTVFPLGRYTLSNVTDSDRARNGFASSPVTRTRHGGQHQGAVDFFRG